MLQNVTNLAIKVGFQVLAALVFWVTGYPGVETSTFATLLAAARSTFGGGRELNLK